MQKEIKRNAFCLSVFNLLFVFSSLFLNYHVVCAWRNVLSIFSDLETTTSLIGMAPQPNITVGVRQSGRLVTGELNVSPGTPLQMEISLDSASTPIYGLLVTHMQVSDTKAQEETIIYNG